MSPTPVCEALFALTREGLVDRSPRRRPPPALSKRPRCAPFLLTRTPRRTGPAALPARLAERPGIQHT
ncbi:hypothetical protein AB3X91_36690 [Paraburkholderia sp. BR14263]|uniref:hypothetical protein n=1 Tax=unclassified Paraburkholderia TaxID=2615204 RepID=UPI0034CD4832